MLTPGLVATGTSQADALRLLWTNSTFLNKVVPPGSGCSLFPTRLRNAPSLRPPG